MSCATFGPERTTTMPYSSPGGGESRDLLDIVGLKMWKVKGSMLSRRVNLGARVKLSIRQHIRLALITRI